MKPGFYHIGAAVAAILVASAAPAADAGTIVYKVDQTIGAGSVIGTITTDGATGVLVNSDITAWNLDLKGPGAAINLTSANSNVLLGNGFDPFNPSAGNGDLTADSKHLYFNYDAVDKGYFGIQISDYSGANYWCNAVSNQGFDCAPGKSVVPQFFSNPSAQYAAATGNQVIGVAGGVPEPTIWSMMFAGFGALGATLRVRRRADHGVLTA